MRPGIGGNDVLDICTMQLNCFRVHSLLDFGGLRFRSGA